jgi:hypothetical protein
MTCQQQHSIPFSELGTLLIDMLRIDTCVAAQFDDWLPWFPCGWVVSSVACCGAGRGFDTSLGYLSGAEDHYTQFNSGELGCPGVDLWQNDHPACVVTVIALSLVTLEYSLAWFSVCLHALARACDRCGAGDHDRASVVALSLPSVFLWLRAHSMIKCLSFFLKLLCPSCSWAWAWACSTWFWGLSAAVRICVFFAPFFVQFQLVAPTLCDFAIPSLRMVNAVKQAIFMIALQICISFTLVTIKLELLPFLVTIVWLLIDHVSIAWPTAWLPTYGFGR